VEVYGRVDAQVILIKVWIQLAYWIFSQWIVITCGVDVYVPVAWWGWWEKIGSWILMQKWVR
jgi:hypothetical protein